MSQKGYVYILTNPSMPGLVKIGKTTRDVEQRAIELYQTGVPEPFEVQAQFYSPDCAALENKVHDELSEYRQSMSREFFRVDPATAYNVLTDSAHELVGAWMRDFLLPGAVINYRDFCLDSKTIVRLSEGLSCEIPNLFMAIKELTIEELKPALERAVPDKPDHLELVSNTVIEVEAVEE